MSDFTRCIAALNKAAGRELTADEVQDVFDRIQRTARDIAAGRRNTGGQPDVSTPEGVMQYAAELAAGEMVAEKLLAQRRAQLQVVVVAQRSADIAAMRQGGIGGVDAVRRLIANDADGRADQFSLEARVLGVTSMLKARIQDTWEALGSDYLGFIQQKDKIRTLLREMRGEDTGDALAKKAAAAWLETADSARQWFNAKGGKVGHLQDWSLPQHHSQERVAKAGLAQWMADVYPALNRDRYLDGAGNRMGEAEIKGLLEGVWNNVATNGAGEIQPGSFRGTAAVANLHAEHRELHFRDADSVLGYWEKYGEKTFPDVLLGHVDRMARDIAFIEHFGPNPEHTYRMLRDQAEQSAKLLERQPVDRVDKQLASLDNLYEYAAGHSKPVANLAVSRGFQVVRDLNVAGKLGSAFFASLFGDKVMLEAVGRLNHLPAFQSWMNELRLLNPANVAERRQLRRQGLMLDYMRSAMYRFGESVGESAWSGKLANSVMRVSGMGAINEWRRGAFGLSMMDAIGHEVQAKDFAQIGKQDARLLHTFGITEADWAVWKLARLEDYGHGNDTMLTPEAIGKISDEALVQAGLVPADAGPRASAQLRRDAIVKYLGALHSESMNAVIEPTWAERSMMVSGLQRGRARDELMLSFWQFKAFPVAAFHRMWDLSMARETTGGKVGMLSTIMLMQTLAGAMMLQTQALLSGQDPRAMDDWKFWAAAALKGGTLGVYGDFLYSQNASTRYGWGPLETLAGPTIGTAAAAVTALVQAGNAMAEGKETHLGAKLLGLGKGFIPFQNLWYTRAATDHIIFQNAQEQLSPGYLANMRANSMRQYRQDWWWAPGEFTPERAPDLGAALGP